MEAVNEIPSKIGPQSTTNGDLNDIIIEIFVVLTSIKIPGNLPTEMYNYSDKVYLQTYTFIFFL